MSNRAISKSVIKRLPVYLRILDNLIRRDVEIISSKELSNESGFTAEQIRKDLAYFGAFGTRGTGYNTSYLREKIIKIIGLDKKTDVIVLGAGHLGTALTRLRRKSLCLSSPFWTAIRCDRQIFRCAGFTGRKPALMDYQIKVAIVTVPSDEAQGVVDMITAAGVRAILNFAPAKIHVPEGVHVFNADLTIELQSLIYYSSAEDERFYRLKQEKLDKEKAQKS